MKSRYDHFEGADRLPKSKKRVSKRKTEKTEKKESRPGSGERFKKLSDTIKKEYMKKGKSKEEAEKIADATTAKSERLRYGKNKLAKMAAAGRRRALRKRK